MLTIFMVMAVVEGYSARAKRNPEKKNRGKRHLTVSLANHASAFRVFRADDTTSQCNHEQNKERNTRNIVVFIRKRAKIRERAEGESVSRRIGLKIHFQHNTKFPIDDNHLKIEFIGVISLMSRKIRNDDTQ